MELVVRQLLISCLIEAGDIEQAKALLADNRQRYEDSGDPAHLMRLPWSEGLIAKSEGDFPRAEKLLREARRGFLRDGSLDTWANISLDLAAVFAMQQRYSELRELASSLLETFLNIGIHREALTSLVLLVQASQQENVSLGQLREVARALEKPARLMGKPS